MGSLVQPLLQHQLRFVEPFQEQESLQQPLLFLRIEASPPHGLQQLAHLVVHHRAAAAGQGLRSQASCSDPAARNSCSNEQGPHHTSSGPLHGSPFNAVILRCAAGAGYSSYKGF